MPTEVPEYAESGKKSGDPDVELMLSGLPVEARELLVFLSPPHWIDDAVLRRVSYDKKTIVPDALEFLEKNGLIERWSDGSRAVRGVVRRHLLDILATQTPDHYRSLAGTFAEAFAETAANGGDVYHHIESVFHRLAADPSKGEVQLLSDGIAWKSEPLNAFEALARLIDAAREQQKRGFLSERAVAIALLLQLYLPRPVKSALEEEQILRDLAARTDLGPLFAAEVALRSGLNDIIRGRIFDASKRLGEAYVGFRKLKLVRGEGDALRALGRTALREDNLASAHRYFTRALKVFRLAELNGSAAHCVKSLAETTFYLGNFPSAETRFKEALTAFQNIGGSLGEANTRVVYSQLLAARAQFVEAHNEIEQARRVYTTIDQGLGLGNCLKNDGVAFFEAERYIEAMEKLAEARRAYAEWGSISGDANCDLWSAACLIRQGQPQAALPRLDRAIDMFLGIGDRFGQASVRREQGVALSSLGNVIEAMDKLEAAEQEFLAIGNVVEATATAVTRGFVAGMAGFSDGQDRAHFLGVARRAQRTFKRAGHVRRLREAEELRELADTA
jgi:tetratricopeptide (TPR) repeat protein